VREIGDKFGYLIAAGGLALTVLCGYGIYWLINMLLQGILSANWLMVIGGGILMYLFLGLLVVGAIVGIYFIGIGLDSL